MTERIRYVPGLVSLVILAPACVIRLQAQRAFEQQHCFDLIFKAPFDPNSDALPPPPVPDIADPRWVHFTMDGKSSANEHVLTAFRDSLRVIERSEDEYPGLHVHFGQAATYGTVMAALEVCRNTVNGYLIQDRDLWAYYVPPVGGPTNHDHQSQDIEYLLHDDVIQVHRPAIGQPWFSKLWNFLRSDPHLQVPWPIAVAHLILVGTSCWWPRRQWRTG